MFNTYIIISYSQLIGNNVISFSEKKQMSVKKYRLGMLYHKSKPYHREKLSYEFVLFQQYEHVMQEYTTKTDITKLFTTGKYPRSHSFWASLRKAQIHRNKVAEPFDVAF